MGNPPPVGQVLHPGSTLSHPRSYPSPLPHPSHLPQHPASGMGGLSPVPNLASPSLSDNSSRYHDHRSQLGVAASAPSPQIPHPLPNRSISHNPSPSLPPSKPSPMTRSWTLDAPPHLDPQQSPSHLSLPLTRSPLHHQPLLRSERGLSMHSSSQAVSPVPSNGSFPGSGSERRNSQRYGELEPRRPRMKSRKSGPPKAKLGGPGGKTFDEMLAAGEVKDRRPFGSPLLETSDSNADAIQGQAATEGAAMSLRADGKETAVYALDGADIEGTTSTNDQGRIGAIERAISTAAGSLISATDGRVMWKGKEVVVHVPTPNDQRNSFAAPLAAEPVAKWSSSLTTTAKDWNDDTAFGEDPDPWRELGRSSTSTKFPSLASPSTKEFKPTSQAKSTEKDKGSKRGDELLDSKDGQNPWDAPAEGTLLGFGRPAESPDTPANIEKKAGRRKKKGAKEDADARSASVLGTGPQSGKDDDPWEAPAQSGSPPVPPARSKIRGIAELPPKPSLRDRETTRLGSKQPYSSATTDPTASRGAASDPLSPTAIDSRTKRTFSAAGLGGNAFLRKSLGGMLKEAGTVRRRSSARGSDAASRIATGTSADDAESPVEHEIVAESTHTPIQTLDAKSPGFDRVPVDGKVQPAVEHEAKLASVVVDVAAGESSTKTITPAKSRMLTPLLRTQQAARQAWPETEPSHVATHAEGNEGSPVDREETITAAKRLRPSAPVFVPPCSQATLTSTPSILQRFTTSETAEHVSTDPGDASTTVLPPKLRPTAAGFTPATAVAAPTALSDETSSTSINQAGDRRASLDTDEQSQKRAKLRPTAKTFVPHPVGPTRRAPPATNDQPGADNGPRIAPDSFSFTPQLSITGMRPNANASAFVPNANAAPFAPRPPAPGATFARHPNGLSHSQFTFVSPGGPHFNPSFFRPGMAGAQRQPTSPMDVLQAHLNPAFMQRGPKPVFRPQGFDQYRPIGGQIGGPSSSPGSVDVPGSFNRRPVSSTGSEGAHKLEERPIVPLTGIRGEQRPGQKREAEPHTQSHPHDIVPGMLQSANTRERSSPNPSPPPSIRSPTRLPPDGDAKVAGARDEHGSLAPAPNSSGTTFEPGILASTPVKSRDGQASTDGTFTTADGSPLLPQRLTPTLSPFRPALASSVLPVANPQENLETTLRPVPDSPLLGTVSVNRTAERWWSFPRPEIKVDAAADDRRFREWTFPANRGGSFDRPSISRRHTMPVDDVEQPHPRLGVASTLAGRVQEFRQLLGRGSMDEGDAGKGSIVEEDEEELNGDAHRDRRTSIKRDMSAQSSVEFPMREERKTLKVVNATPTGSLSPGFANRAEKRASLGVVLGSPIVESPGALDDAERLSQVVMALGRVDAGLRALKDKKAGEDILERIKEELTKTRQTVAESRQEVQSALDASSNRAAIEQIADAIEQQASILSTIRDAGELHRDDWLQAQTKEPFEAVLEGQRSIFDKIAQAFESKVSTMETLGRIMAVQDDIAGSLIDGRATQDKIDQLRKELEMVKGRLIKAQTENEGLESRMKSLAREAEQARGELEVVQIRLDAMMERERVVRNELDTSQATCSAAERERDALSEVLQADVAKKEMLIKEMEGLRGELAAEREKAEKDKEGAVSLAEMATTAATLHEEVLNRMTRLDEGILKATGARAKEYERILHREESLEQELGSLRAKYKAVVQENTELRLAQQHVKAQHASALAVMRHELELEVQARKTEMASREDAEQKITEMQKQLDILRTQRESAVLMANERASWARMSEVRLQSLSQEAVYWRQFALETDRRKCRAYMGSNPFHNGSTVAKQPTRDQDAHPTDMSMSLSEESHLSHGSPPDTLLKTPADLLRNGIGAAEMQTPTKANGEKQPLKGSTPNLSIADAGEGSPHKAVHEQIVNGLRGTRVEGEEGTMWTVA